VTAPVLVISGCSAVGKSTVSRLLAECLDSSVHIPADVFLRFFDDPFPDPATPEGADRAEVVGAALAATAAQFALGGYTVILDGPLFPDGADGVAEICPPVSSEPNTEIRQVPQISTGSRHCTPNSLTSARAKLTPSTPPARLSK
jgi:hypothetical protein